MEQYSVLNSLMPKGTFKSMSKGELGYYLLTFTDLPKEIRYAIHHPEMDVNEITDRGLCVKCGEIGSGKTNGKIYCSPNCAGDE